MNTPDRDDGDQEIHFHYDRSKRLDRASPDVRWLAERQKKGRPSVIAGMLSNKPLVILFLTLVIATVIVNLMGFLGGIPDRTRLGAYSFFAQAFIFDGDAYVTVIAKADREASPGGSLSITSPTEGNAPTVVRDILPLSGVKEYRFILPGPAAAGSKLGMRIVTPAGSTVLTAEISGGARP
ncbi:MAG: hypothetical protein NT080_12180 [Spirochaetes bacterium]|nr:hypothetical protein [Spirochaetota bacterium]